METERDYETSLSAFMRLCKRLISKMHYTAADYSEQHELGVGVLPGSLPSGQVLHWAGKTKGQGQAGVRVSWDMQGGVRHCSTETMMLWHHHHYPPPPWPLSGTACQVHGALVLVLQLPSRSNTCQFYLLLFLMPNHSVVGSLPYTTVNDQTSSHSFTHMHTPWGSRTWTVSWAAWERWCIPSGSSWPAPPGLHQTLSPPPNQPFQWFLSWYPAHRFWHQRGWGH